mmetsp:Transcript_13998/g.23189  ORF Transcript_13998/g.23189 Transcript_13998/m.23189 type:complete len:94 (-) Transcript_13998:36-317(-)
MLPLSDRHLVASSRPHWLFFVAHVSPKNCFGIESGASDGTCRDTVPLCPAWYEEDVPSTFCSSIIFKTSCSQPDLLLLCYCEQEFQMNNQKNA